MDIDSHNPTEHPSSSSKPDDSKNVDPPLSLYFPNSWFHPHPQPYVESVEKITNSVSGCFPPAKTGRIKIFKRPERLSLDGYAREGFDEKIVYARRHKQEILKADLSCEITKAKYVNTAKIAIGAFNEKYNNNPQLEYEDLVKATYQNFFGELYYLTIRAKSSDKEKSETYQAILSACHTVLAFRLKPKRVKRGPKKWFWNDPGGELGKYIDLQSEQIKEEKRMLASEKSRVNKQKGKRSKDL